MENLIIEYEKTRQNVAALVKKRSEMFRQCERLPRDNKDGEICLIAAFREMQSLNARNDDFYDYDEVLSSGEYCDTCRENYRIKHQDLASAKYAFGVAKRMLSAAGKRLIKARHP